MIAFINASSSLGSKVKQFSPVTTNSFTPPELLHITAQPQAIASKGGKPNPSHQEVEIKISEELYAVAIS